MDISGGFHGHDNVAYVTKKADVCSQSGRLPAASEERARTVGSLTDNNPLRQRN